MISESVGGARAQDGMAEGAQEEMTVPSSSVCTQLQDGVEDGVDEAELEEEEEEEEEDEEVMAVVVAGVVGDVEETGVD